MHFSVPTFIDFFNDSIVIWYYGLLDGILQNRGLYQFSQKAAKSVEKSLLINSGKLIDKLGQVNW